LLFLQKRNFDKELWEKTMLYTTVIRVLLWVSASKINMLLKLVNMQNYSHVYSAHLFQTESSLRQILYNVTHTKT
jgi:hypothetical protein